MIRLPWSWHIVYFPWLLPRGTLELRGARYTPGLASDISFTEFMWNLDWLVIAGVYMLRSHFNQYNSCLWTPCVKPNALLHSCTLPIFEFVYTSHLYAHLLLLCLHPCGTLYTIILDANDTGNFAASDATPGDTLEQDLSDVSDILGVVKEFSDLLPAMFTSCVITDHGEISAKRALDEGAHLVRTALHLVVAPRSMLCISCLRSIHLSVTATGNVCFRYLIG